ncbi:MAG: TonB-dependent receptor [Caulobacteraceae bacterium]
MTATSVLALAMGLSAAAHAQAPAPASDDSAVGEVIVTGSRVINTGLKAPTPVTTVSAQEILALSPTTLISALSQLPQFYGNTSNDVRSNFFASPGAGNLNLRGLNTGGSGRTLTLLDGRRIVPANGYGSVDINVLPQSLIKRIETVTGGASAAYGTDAVAGAVNFILDTGYTGWEVSAQGGVTSRGDHGNMQFSGTWGTAIGSRAHLLLNAEYYHADGIDSFTQRDWYKGYSLINNPSTDPNAPRYISRPNVVTAISTFGGLINSGVPTTSALYRRYFRPDGTLTPFVLGEGTATQAHSITNGGSGDDVTGNLVPLAPEARRGNAFAYLSYDATPNLHFYAQGLAGLSMTDQPDHGGRYAGVAGIDTRITIFRENAFLPAAVRQIMINENLQSFQMNLTGDREGLGRNSHVKQENRTYSGTAGFKWEITRPGWFNGWNVDGYAQYGTADNKGYQEGVLLDRISAAVDAVVDPATGKTVCRAALQNPGKWGSCVPINLFGRGAASDAAIAYVTAFTPGQQITSPLYFQPDGYDSGETVSFTSGPGKVYNTRTTQKVAELSASGKVWDGWAGPIAAAFGASYRKETINQIVYDPSNPASDPNIFPAVDPALRAVPPYTATRSSMVQNSTVANVHGSYDVKEVFTEWQAPLLAGLRGIQNLNLLASARYAVYTGSGGVWSWKTGLDWQVYSDLRLRGTISRDVRAATLLERFNQTGGVGTVTKDPRFPNDGTQSFSSRAGGNPDLDPETSTTYTYGFVYQPSWLSGFSASVDYWDIDIAGAIGSLGFQRIVDDCFASPSSSVCKLVTRDATTGRLSQVRNVTQNIAAAAGRGVDVEVGYRRSINLFRGGGETVAARVFWSHLMENSSTTDRANPATYFDSAGQIGVASGSGNLPKDSVTATLSYDMGGLNLALTERFISSGINNKRYNLPGVRPDLADNTVPAVAYTNLSATYSWNIAGGKMELSANIQNLFDKDPPVVPSLFDASLGQTGNQINSSLYDLLGRRFTVGLKFRH